MLGILAVSCAAQDAAPTYAGSAPNLDVLSAEQWRRIDASVDRGLEFLARQQQDDGSFEAPPGGQPAISSLCIMAFLSRGHTPGAGPYGERLQRGIEYVLSLQHESGLLSIEPVGSYRIGRPIYNHGIAGLMLGEVYGMTSGDLEERIRQSVVRALRFSRERQLSSKRHSRDKGGWRYIRPYGANDADLTATCWHLMFYRSAMNAGFEVPVEFIDDATAYVRRCYRADEGDFVYALADDEERYASGATVAGGVIALAMAGEHNTEMAQSAGRWILRHPFSDYNRRRHPDDRYHYSAYYCSQAMFQLGGDYWEQFYPGFQQVLLENQNADGSWEPEAIQDERFGNVYTTALSVLSLTPPYQLLPIYQR